MIRASWPNIFIVFLIFTMTSLADQVQIVRYDITDAVLSGHGFWFHKYGGTITPGASFENGGTDGTVGVYSGGSGTLNDLMIGVEPADSQLFVEGTPTGFGPAIHPVLTLFLSGFYTIDRISIYGGDFGGNAIPGCIDGVTVGIGGSSAAISTSSFGPTGSCGNVNDLADLTLTSLAGLSTNRISLYNFKGSPLPDNWFSITEITVEGTPAAPPAVPEPASLTLAGSALCALVAMRLRANGIRAQKKH